MNATTACCPVAMATSSGLPVFEFHGHGRSLRASGEAQPLAAGARADLPGRIGAALSACPDRVVAGAMPFLAGDADAFWIAMPDRNMAQAGLHSGAKATPQTQTVTSAGWKVEELPPGRDYAAAVDRALLQMEKEAGTPNGLRKIVLARSLQATAPTLIDLPSVLQRLSSDPAATAFLTRLPDLDGRQRHLVGATPELLVAKTGALVVSHPLAGSARRNALDASADRAAAEGLDRSEKDRREHAHVVEFILDTLAPFCADLGCPDGTVLTSTRSMWHLGTRIEGRLRDPEMPSAALAVALHPTPAVCGVPQARAADWIGRLEPHLRDFYSGAVGWSDVRGDGEWFVTIRCAEVSGHTARLFAGAGIVEGSDSEEERAETAAKFAALLAGLGLEGRLE